jgi:hypothetical protein
MPVLSGKRGRWKAVSATAGWTFPPPRISRLSCWCSLRLDEEDKYIILPYFWIPEETLDLRVKRDHVNYDLWERQGFLQTTEGNVVHYGYIEKFIERLGERSISVRLPSTAGAPFRWCRTLRAWVSRSFLSDRASRI